MAPRVDARYRGDDMGHRRDIKVVVTDHAKDRLRERFPEMKPARIVDEVRAALVAGRLGVSKPPGLFPPNDPDTLYAWTENGARIYALHSDGNYGEAWKVLTVLRSNAGAGAAAS